VLTELYAAPPDRFVAGWDSTVNTRYGHQGDTAVSYNHHKRGRKSPHALVCVAAQVVEIGRQRAHQLAAKSEWWQLLKGCGRGWQQLRVLGSEQNPNGSKARQKGGENTAEKKTGRVG